MRLLIAERLGDAPNEHNIPAPRNGWSGDTLVWSSPPGLTPANRYAYTRLSPDRMRVDWSMVKLGGEYEIGDTLTCVRIRAVL